MTRSRSARLALLAVTLAVPLAGAVAPPAFASGDSAVVSAVVTNGNVHVQSTKGLSRVTVVLCDGVTVVADSWQGEQKSGDVPVDGVVQAVFIHSGRNTTAQAQALLALLAGAGAVKGESTGAIAFHDDDACVEATTTTTSTTTTTVATTGSSTTTTTTGNHPTTTTTPTGPTSTTTMSPTTVTTMSPTTVTTAGGGTTTTPSIGVSVLGETLEKKASEPDPAAVSPGSMARTGAGHVMFLLTLGAGLIAAGIALLSAFRRRRAHSASSPC